MLVLGSICGPAHPQCPLITCEVHTLARGQVTDDPWPKGSLLSGHLSRLANEAVFLFAQLMRIRVTKRMAGIQYTLPVNRHN